MNKKVIQPKSKTNSVTFIVEDLERPTEFLVEKPIDQILKKFSIKIEAYSKIESPIVSNGFHSFLYGMYQAYAEHRPFTLSPDMIWLLICQGFSRHVNFSHNTQNEIFPHLNTKKTIEIVNKKIKLGDPTSPWHEATNQFIKGVSDQAGSEIVEILRADFSTTGITEKVACEITIMDAMKPYFEYIVTISICGIPEITLEGTTEDWEKILDKLSRLRKFKMGWWVDKLEPIIQEFVLASRGTVNKNFWMNMFKEHTLEEYGSPKYIDGWITKFYPYDRMGNLIDFRKMTRWEVESICEELPKELVCVDFIYRIKDDLGNILSETPMEYWAGFIGLTQNKEDYGLRPEIGWFVCHKREGIPDESPLKNSHGSQSRVYYNLNAFPKEVLKKKEWDTLVLNFKNEIDIPLSVLKLSTFRLELNGKLRKRDLYKLPLLRSKFSLDINGDYS